MNLGALLQLPPHGLAVFLLVLVRASAIFLTAPVLGNANVPARVKIGLSALMALIMTPMLMELPVKADIDSIWGIVPAVISELVLGILIGLLAQFFFVAIQFAGQVVGLQMGFGMASVFDPHFGASVSVTGQFYLLVGILVFLLLDGHHWILIALQKSFTTIPLASFAFDAKALGTLLAASNDLFWVALMLMAPVLGVLVLGEVAMAIVARIMPQMNVFVAAFPVKIFLGVLTMALSFPLLVGVLGSETERTFTGILDFVDR
jgi:flagellar biosynthetic protein FliR